MTVPRVGQRGQLMTNVELAAVVHRPPRGYGKYAVLLQGAKQSSIRGGLKVINEWDHETNDVAFDKLNAAIDSEGHFIKWVASTDEDFLLRKSLGTLIGEIT